mmetsp:Transcript_93037/g.221210  ORF Transcript_93037/g.221210 Transcript_93037/m.221210 type:complete len:246 (+) Transcript_93037:674-1411(+)
MRGAVGSRDDHLGVAKKAGTKEAEHEAGVELESNTQLQVHLIRRQLQANHLVPVCTRVIGTPCHHRPDADQRPHGHHDENQRGAKDDDDPLQPRSQLPGSSLGLHDFHPDLLIGALRHGAIQLYKAPKALCQDHKAQDAKDRGQQGARMQPRRNLQLVPQALARCAVSTGLEKALTDGTDLPVDFLCIQEPVTDVVVNDDVPHGPGQQQHQPSQRQYIPLEEGGDPPTCVEQSLDTVASAEGAPE